MEGSTRSGETLLRQQKPTINRSAARFISSGLRINFFDKKINLKKGINKGKETAATRPRSDAAGLVFGVGLMKFKSSGGPFVWGVFGVAFGVWSGVVVFGLH